MSGASQVGLVIKNLPVKAGDIRVKKWKWKFLSYVRLFETLLQARILEGLAFPFSRGSSQPRDRTQVSHTAGGFFIPLSHKGSPRILEWVAYPFSRGSSGPRNQTGIFCIAGGFFTKNALSGQPMCSITGSGRSPGEGMATHYSILAWRISRTEDPGGLQFMRQQIDTTEATCQACMEGMSDIQGRERK